MTIEPLTAAEARNKSLPDGPRLRLMSLSIVAALAIAGCGPSGKPGIPVHPTSGRLLTKAGKPAVGATVSLHPIGRAEPLSYVPHGDVDAEGNFRLTSNTPDDGAPEGEYGVTITWRTMTKEGEAVGPDQLQGRFANPKNPFRKVTIRAGDNKLEPFLLK